MGLFKEARRKVVNALKEKNLTLYKNAEDSVFGDQNFEKESDVSDFLLNTIIQFCQLQKEIEDQRREIEALKSNATQKKKGLVVMSPSSCAKDDESRTQFRTDVVSGEHCRGGFVCHPMYVEFVKAARSMFSNPQRQNCEEEEEEENDQKIEKTAEELQKEFGTQLSKRGPSFPFFDDNYPNEETPQSMWFTFCLRNALTSMNAPRELLTEHQCSFIAQWESDTICKSPPRKRGASNTESSTPNKKQAKTVTKEKRKLDFKMDTYCMIPKEGTTPVACFEYKPDTSHERDREAQADMCAHNVQVVLEKPCLSVAVAGGNDPEKWEISACALVPRPEGWPGESNCVWDKCPLYEGRGFDGLVRMAAGIVASLPHLSKKKDQFGSRMGPVVGVYDNRVFKAYDRAETRKPNIHLIQKFVDTEAKLWKTSVGGDLEILEMKFLDNIWNQIDELRTPVCVTVLISILNDLSKLHEEDYVHGDIRLNNVLSCGKIVDFDFAGKDGIAEYPKGLLELHDDGERHPEVSTWIENGCQTSLVLKKEHDLHSMKKVMNLFKIHVEEFMSGDVTELKDAWTKSMDLVGGEKVSEAIRVLEEHIGTMKLVLTDGIVAKLSGHKGKLVGTGATPQNERKQ